eukprot:14356846-Alexandrium_andersonii.AAC.1
MSAAATHPAVSIAHRISLSGSCRRRVTSCLPTWATLISFPVSMRIRPRWPRTRRKRCVSP